MLTMKVVKNDGSEWIEEVTSIHLNIANQSPTKRKYISYFSPKYDFSLDVFEGQVYIMNELGKTIETYLLLNG